VIPASSSTLVDTAPGSPPALALEGISAGYGRTTVLRDVSLEVPAGSVVALLGPNGAGKTTLLKVASGLLRPTAGQVRLLGKDITREPVHRRADRGLGHIPEGRGIYRSLTVRDNLRMQAPRKLRDEAIERAVSAFPVLGERLGQVAGTMSGGQQQMLSMAAAYVRGSQVIIVDEPSLGLAPVVVDAVFEFLETVVTSGVSLLVVDQFVARALAIASTAYVLRRGEIVFHGLPEELGEGLFERYVED
jgi:branched-chain amino acid transport system ATP-binding protein